MADVAFTFDPKPVLDGVRRINRGMNEMTARVGQSAQSMSRAVSRGILRAVALVGTAVAAFKGMSAVVKQHIPEIGETFKVVQEIFFKNFLWPLRQELMPILQRILDWARDNRAVFVRWGQAVANVFRAVVRVARQVVEWGRGIFEILGATFQRLFGDQVRSWEEAWNLLTAKIAVAAAFMGHLIQGVIEWFAELAERWGPRAFGAALDLVRRLLIDSGLIAEAWETVKTVIDAVAGIATNLLEGLSLRSLEIGQNLRDALANLRGIIQDWMHPTESGNSIYTLARRLGELMSQILDTATAIVSGFTEGFRRGLEGLMDPLNNIVASFQRIWDMIFGDQAGIKSFFDTLGEQLGRVFVSTLERIAELVLAIEAIVFFIKEFFEETWPTIAARLGLDREREDDGEEGFLKGAVEFVKGFGLWGMGARALADLARDRGMSVDDALITKRGDVVRLNPEDNVLAFKGGMPGGAAQVTVNVEGVNVRVTEGNARVAGEEFGEGLLAQLQAGVEQSMRALGA